MGVSRIMIAQKLNRHNGGRFKKLPTGSKAEKEARHLSF
jgi:hypothetical protein